MKSVVELLEERIAGAIRAVTGRKGCPAIVRPASDARFGDYQANGIMPLAKELKSNPRKLAEQVCAKLDVSDMCVEPEVAGAGFINLRLKGEFVAGRLEAMHRYLGEGFGIDKAGSPETVVVDFSGPNIAKQMHVGHLRSTIIGDCICRLLEFLGHNVIRQNHIGDWGTHFGMLCALFRDKTTAKGTEEFERIGSKWPSDAEILEDMEAFYREAAARYDCDAEFAKDARDAIAGLHRGEKYWKRYWEAIVGCSRAHCAEIYRILGVTLGDKDVRGESAYSDELPKVVEELKQKGLAVESDGAVCVFPEGFANKEGKPLPFIIQKSDGAYLYATTDLAALRYRVRQLAADRIIYVTDARQSLHFRMLFAVADAAGWTRKNGRKVVLEHVTFGSVLGEDGRPLKTRSGENVKLKDLLDEAIERARGVVEQKNPELGRVQKERIAKAVGIGAVKYADFSNNRTSDYIFSFDRMLAMEGNTAPYMQYAYARIRSIERKATSRGIDADAEIEGLRQLRLVEPAELELAKHLIRYCEAVRAAAEDYRPNYLTAYLYELSQKFSIFYTQCPVLAAAPETRPSRLLLCRLTAEVIKHGLSDLLGIEVVEQM